MTLATRLTFFFLSMLAFVLVGFSAALYLLAESYLHRQAEERLESMLNAVTNIIEVGNDDVEWEPKNRTSNLNSAVDGDQIVWIVADDRGHILECSDTRNTERFLNDASPSLVFVDQAERQVNWSGVTWEAGQRWIHPDARLPNHESPAHSQEDDQKHQALSVTVGVSLTPVRATLTTLMATLVSLSLLTWLLALVTSRFVCRRALLPVQRMAASAREISADDPTQRLPALETKDELADLNRAFNSLLNRLQVTFERQQRFTGEASHQLRTPLAGIMGQIEVALRRDRSADEYRLVLEKVQRRASHLVSMAEALLFLARADAEARLPVSEPVHLREWTPQHLQSWADHARTNDLVFESTTTDPCTIHAHPALLGELLDILLDNAAKYSELGTPITVRLGLNVNVVTLSVEDRGCGIAEYEIETLFVPFNRSEGARRRGIKGVGLGLSIAKRLVGVFEGELLVSSHLAQGSCFTLRFEDRSQSLR